MQCLITLIIAAEKLTLMLIVDGRKDGREFELLCNSLKKQHPATNKFNKNNKIVYIK